MLNNRNQIDDESAIKPQTISKTTFIRELQGLETEVVYLIMAELYEDIRHRPPHFMKKWTKDRMIGWFTHNYTFDFERQTWYFNSDSI